ncbi:MAG: AAA family ATPase [Actinobacteria bacterium]|nr:AAA family ATPase [Actinomycetota bacterium]
MNLFRSEEHVKRWQLYARGAEDYIMPVTDWARVFSGPMFRNRLDPDYLDNVDAYLQKYHDDLHELGKASPLWQYPLIGALDVVALRRYSVVGNYSRYDDAVLNNLKDARNRIVAGIDSSAPSRENHLVWAAPGAGKTYLIQEIARSLGERCRYVEINLAKHEADEFTAALRSLPDDSTTPALCLIDECDAHADESWPYEILMPQLDVAVEGRAHVVFVLAGSSGFSLDGLKQRMAARRKGADVLSRIPEVNQFVIPAMSFGDRVLVVIAQLIKAAHDAGHAIYSIEKLGLYYAAVNSRLANARQLQEFSTRAIGRVTRGDDRVKYDDMFAAGDPENKRFWLNVASIAGDLINTYVRIET